MPPEFSVYSEGTVKKVAIIVVVLLVLVIGLPLAMGMSDMAPCPSCTGADNAVAVAMCLAIVSLFVLVVSSSSSRILMRRQLVRLALLADPPERPPRLGVGAQCARPLGARYLASDKEVHNWKH